MRHFNNALLSEGSHKFIADSYQEQDYFGITAKGKIVLTLSLHYYTTIGSINTGFLTYRAIKVSRYW